jgi:hypothetical protein
LEILQRGVDLGMKPDGIFLPEDMGYKTALLLGTRTWDALLRSCYERIGEFVRRHGIRFLLHSDGRMWDLLSRLLEVGVEALNPFECAADMDIAELRRPHPRQMTCYGNLSVKSLLGTRADLEEELQRKIPEVLGILKINYDVLAGKAIKIPEQFVGYPIKTWQQKPRTAMK